MGSTTSCPSDDEQEWERQGEGRPTRRIKATRVSASQKNAVALKDVGLHVSDDLEDGHDGILMLNKRPRPQSEVRMEQFYLVYNVEVSDEKPTQVMAPPKEWTSHVVCEQGQRLHIKFSWCCRQNHTCRTQLLLRLCTDSGEIVRHFPIASSEFYAHKPEKVCKFSFLAPEIPGRYFLDWVTDWQNSMQNAEERVRQLASKGKLTYIYVGQSVPWTVERVIWLGHKHPSSAFSLLTKDVMYKVLARCGDWREDCECERCANALPAVQLA